MWHHFSTVNICTILLLQLFVASSTAQAACQLWQINEIGYTKLGSIIVGGIFQLHYKSDPPDTSYRGLPKVESCKTLRMATYLQIQSMIYAIEQINRNPYFLPNVTLGYSIYDSCGMESKAFQGSMWLLTGQSKPVPNYSCKRSIPMSAVLGESQSLSSVAMAQLLGLYRYTQISYGSTAIILSDKYQFPSFLRTMPSDDVKLEAIALMARNFDWTWIGILAEESDTGQTNAQLLKSTLIKAGICVAFSGTVPTVFNLKKIAEAASAVQKSSSRVIILILSKQSLIPMMEELAKQKITGRVLITTDSFSPCSLLFTNTLMAFLNGSLAFSALGATIPGLKNYILGIHPSKAPNDIFTIMFWEEVFGCKWLNGNQSAYSSMGLQNSTKICTGKENLGEEHLSLFDFGNLRYPYNVYKAVYAVAQGLHNMYSCTNKDTPLGKEMCRNNQVFEPWKVFSYVRNVQFKISGTDDVFFDANGNPPAQYDILNCRTTQDGTARYRTIGRYDSLAPSGRSLIVNESDIAWSEGNMKVPQSVCSETCLAGFRKAIRPGHPICCFDCIQCAEGEISNQTGSTACIKCQDDHWPNARRDACSPKPMEFLAYRDSLGLTLAAVACFCALVSVLVLVIFAKHHDTPIVRANNRGLSYFLLLGLALCFLCSLLFIGLPTSLVCKFRQIAFGLVFVFCVSCVLSKTIVVIFAFRATKPNSNLSKWVGPQIPIVTVFICVLLQIIICAIWLIVTPPFSEQNMKSQIGKISLECNEGSVVAFWSMLGYIGSLSCVSFVVAFLARNLPDSFNEAKFITFSMLVFVSVWLSFIPAYLSTKGKYMVAVEVFAILSSSAGLLSCIFFPKCYIILLRPELNTRGVLMGKRKFECKNE